MQIENLQKQKANLQEQLKDSRVDAKKHQDELIRVQRKLTEKEWEYDALKKDFDSQKEIIRKLREEKSSLEKENEDLRRELSSSQALVPSPGERKDDSDELVAVRQEITEWETSYKFVHKEKEELQEELLTLQSKLNDLQADYDRAQRELQKDIMINSLKASKHEAQMQNAFRQRDNFKNQLEGLRDDHKKGKEGYSLLQRDFLETQKKADIRQLECFSVHNH